MQKIEIKAETRIILGKPNKKLRARGIVPGVIYGDQFKARSIQVSLKDFQKVYAEAGESTLVYVNLDNEAYPTIIHDVSVDSIQDNVLHVDFYKVSLDEKIHAKIAVEIIGEAPAVKDFGGILVKNINEIEVEGFPQDLPHKFTVDVSVLKQIKDQITVKDMTIPKGIELKTSPNDIIVLIQEPISEEQLKAELETTSATSTDDVELIKKEKKEAEPGEEGEAVPTAKAAEGKPAGKKEEKK